MSRASSLARAFGADGVLNTSDVSGLGALAALNTVGTSQIDDSAITSAKIAAGAIPPSDDASALTTGTLAVARLPNEGLSLGSRNRIINGDMRIDQRNAGAAVSISGGNNKYTLDRFNGDNSSSNGQVYSLQQVSDGPVGFSKSIKATVTTSGSASTANYQYFRQAIEGYNFADLDFGTANAKSFTLSFWVKSSITGTHGGYLGAISNNRFRIFTYTINSANTWEYKTVTITGDTSGTWNSTNDVGLQVAWSLGCGTSYQGSPGTWGNSLFLGATGQVQLLETNGATWQITGVQLEVGSVATPFERRPYGTELALCQRYYYLHANNVVDNYIASGWHYSTTSIYVIVYFPTTMRATPTALYSNSSNAYRFWSNGTGTFFNTFTVGQGNENSMTLINGSVSGVTAGAAGGLYGPGLLAFNAEL